MKSAMVVSVIRVFPPLAPALVLVLDPLQEVTLLDPVRFPGAIKAFAREVCR
jgi:hypothetical protein